MKKSISLLAVAAAVGLSALTASPANALSFENCTEAHAAGYYNIPASSPLYRIDLDGNADGVACEDSSKPIGTVPAPEPAPSPAPSPANGAFDNCAEAAAAGQFNIPIGTPGYGEHLDSDKDGIACEQGAESAAPMPETQPVPNPTVAQIPVVPVGGADTGVAQDTGNGVEMLAIGSLVAAAAVGTVVARRRQA